jgi:hypothetical protein
LLSRRLHLSFDGLIFRWIAVQTQRERVTTHEVTRPIVPLPMGSGTNGGDEVGADIALRRGTEDDNDDEKKVRNGAVDRAAGLYIAPGSWHLVAVQCAACANYLYI